MEFLLDNPLASMEGPYFLILYIFVSVFSVITLGYLKSRLDSSDRFAIPAIPSEIDLFETAYLRGGQNELARTLIFSLRKKGYVQIENGDKTAFLGRAPDVGTSRLSDVELLALEWLGPGREVNETFRGRASLVDKLSGFVAQYENRLHQRHLLIPEDSLAKLFRWKLTTMFMIIGLGGYKVLAAVLTGHYNILFTIVLAAIGIAAAWYVGRQSRRTKLGELYLGRLQETFQGLTHRSLIPTLSSTTPATEAGSVGVDTMLVSVAVFGAASVASAEFRDYNEAYKRSQQETTSGGGGCGAGCGSSSTGSSSSEGSSCSSGSSCSGGSSCGGGGCGGCGGS